MVKTPRIAICYPSSDIVQADFTLALAGMCLKTHPLDVVVINPKSSIVAQARNNGVARAQELEADWLLFLDSDMVFPADTLGRLLLRGKDIVGALYTKRLPPYEILGTPAASVADPAHLETNGADAGLVEMRRIPTGCLLIRMRVFEKLTRPYFRFGVNEETGALLGEDYAFCDAARLAGFRIWADLLLSREIGHIGEHISRLSDLPAA